MEVAAEQAIVMLPTFLLGSAKQSYLSLNRAWVVEPQQVALLCCACLFFLKTDVTHGLGSMATIAASFDTDGNAVVCTLVQSPFLDQPIQCWSSVTDSVTLVAPASRAPFLGLCGGHGIVCALRLDSAYPFCWNVLSEIGSPHRLKKASFSHLSVGTSSVCALSIGTGLPICWRDPFIVSSVPSQLPLSSIASGADFVCGLQSSSINQVHCWGNSSQSFLLPNVTFKSIQAGAHHACGLTETFNVQCWGDNTYNQCLAPGGKQFLGLALGDRHSCGIDAFTRHVICWGDSASHRLDAPYELPIISLAAGDSFTCGVVYSNFAIVCWGAQFGTGKLLPLNTTIPNFCIDGDCESGSFQLQPSGICADPNQHVCTPCRIGCKTFLIQTEQCEATHDISCISLGPMPSPISLPTLAPTTSVVIKFKSTSSIGHKLVIVLGALGFLCGILAVAWWIWSKLRHTIMLGEACGGKFHSSATGAGPLPTGIKRQRSLTSLMRSRVDVTLGRGEVFSKADMGAATMGFSDKCKIAAGSFGVVYRGVLPDGREVAIKRGEREARANNKSLVDKESAFQSELEFLSRLHHKHLVSLVGFCNEDDERMLVYDYMPNGTLYDHLHGQGRVGQESGFLPWQIRIKIALEAARGVEYLHSYALPPIIHRDIKSSNILLDGRWSARVSDFGLSTPSPGENSHLSLMAAGTLGYMDPEYYRLQHLTIKSDVYSFGVVLLELLTGQRAIHRHSHGPVNIVDFAVPKIDNNDLASVLDPRPGLPEPHELKALDIIGHLAASCVCLEGKERPSMTEIVDVLEEAMAYVSSNRSWSGSMGTSFAPLEIASYFNDDDDNRDASL